MGNSPFQRAIGLGVDLITSARIVLSDGRIMVANET